MYQLTNLIAAIATGGCLCLRIPIASEYTDTLLFESRLNDGVIRSFRLSFTFCVIPLFCCDE